jgi:hypothetical protein
MHILPPHSPQFTIRLQIFDPRNSKSPPLHRQNASVDRTPIRLLHQADHAQSRARRLPALCRLSATTHGDQGYGPARVETRS